MFYLNRETPLTSDLLYKMIHKFRTAVEPKLNTYKDYYDGVQKILNKQYQSDPSRNCSKAVTNYCKNIVDSYCGYIAAPGCISYNSPDPASFENIDDVLKYNDHRTEDSDFLLQALIYGTANELMYIDNESKVRFRLINPTDSFGVFDDSLTCDLLYFVRMYEASDWDDSNLHYVDVYSEKMIQHYTMQGKDGQLTFIGEEPHYFSQCPANVFVMPDEKSIFDCIIPLQDAFNELLTSEIDDYSAFCDAYLSLVGDFDLEQFKEDLPTMKENRTLVLPKDTVAQYLTKQANDTQVENMLKRIHDSIYRIAQCPDFSSETFVGGVSSGIAIKYRLTGMETRSGIVESLLKKALQRRIEVICGFVSMLMGEEVFRDVSITFKRNIPEDETAVINKVASLKGMVSDKTLLSMLDFIDDIDAELEALEEQKKHNMDIYGLGAFSTDTEEEEDGAEDTDSN